MVSLFVPILLVIVFLWLFYIYLRLLENLWFCAYVSSLNWLKLCFVCGFVMRERGDDNKSPTQNISKVEWNTFEYWEPISCCSKKAMHKLTQRINQSECKYKLIGSIKFRMHLLWLVMIFCHYGYHRFNITFLCSTNDC